MTDGNTHTCTHASGCDLKCFRLRFLRGCRSLGIVEAIGISILLGAAVDYPLHVIESYLESTEHGAKLYAAMKKKEKEEKKKKQQQQRNSRTAGTNAADESTPDEIDDGGGNAAVGAGAVATNGDEDSGEGGSGSLVAAAWTSSNRALRNVVRVTYLGRASTNATVAIGPSIINSAFTTAGCVAFLFFCTIEIFVKVRYSTGSASRWWFVGWPSSRCLSTAVAW